MKLLYRHDLKHKARHLRTNLTDAEQLLWLHLRRKQILDIQFYRQRPIGQYVVDFYAPAIGMVIEVDGGQHFEPAEIEYDSRQTSSLNALGISVVRFDNFQVQKETSSVLEEICRLISHRKSLPPCRPRGPMQGATVSLACSMLHETPAQPSLWKREECIA